MRDQGDKANGRKVERDCTHTLLEATAKTAKAAASNNCEKAVRLLLHDALDDMMPAPLRDGLRHQNARTRQSVHGACTACSCVYALNVVCFSAH